MSDAIVRDVSGAASGSFDLIVVGGGIYGACVTLVAAQRGLRPLLLERGDFGGQTSSASLRIVHGGLRYLQSLDVRRCAESAREQAWFLREFPELVRPLPCLLPLDGRRGRRPAAFGAALALGRACGGRGRRSELPRGEVLSAERTTELFPCFDGRGLLGGGVWHDAVMVCPERLLIEVMRWACGLGATALNYVEAAGLLRSGGAVAGVAARDVATGLSLELRAPVVVNCAGPWCREVAARMGADDRSLIRPSLAFNVLLDRTPPCPMAVAVAPPGAGGRMYFLVPCHGRVMAGTVHLPCDHDPPPAGPSSGQVENFLEELRRAVPGWNPVIRDVVRVLAGVLPAEAVGSAQQAKRPVILDHSRSVPGGARGLWSVSGVKYTTARLVAERVLDRAFGSTHAAADPSRPRRERWEKLLDPAGFTGVARESAAAELGRVVAEESVVRVDDLVLRRSAWGLDPREAATATSRVAELLGLDAGRRGEDVGRDSGALAPAEGEELLVLGLNPAKLQEALNRRRESCAPTGGAGP